MSAEGPTWSGLGELYDGDCAVAEVRYSLLVGVCADHGATDLRDGELVVQRWRGSAEEEPRLEHYRWYTLVLEDGRCYHITVFRASLRSSMYHIVEWRPAGK